LLISHKKASNMKVTHVVAAVVMKDGKVLSMQRCRSKYNYISEHWEFPGGKVEAGECDHEALIREIKEEMDWDIFVGRKLGEVTHEYPDFTIHLSAYLCVPGPGAPTLLEHLDSRWLRPDELDGLNWTEADRELLPFIKALKSLT
jgi:8-oxo-dGTP diphosphatase